MVVQVLLISVPMKPLKLVILACFFSAFLGLKTSTQACNRNDLLALKSFAENLTNSSVTSTWSEELICCQWNGVVCGYMNDSLLVDRVTKLILPCMGLQGTISSSLGQLDQLKMLDLSHNHLEGGLSEELSHLTQLEVLDLSHNMLSGPVLSALSRLDSLQILNISSNLFDGELFELYGFHQLVIFDISYNSFTGHFNSQICNTSHGIQIIDVSANRLSGTIEGLNYCSSSLKQFHADFNLFGGHFPESLYSLISLEHLSLSGNNFSGRLSVELSKLWRLKYFVIFGNQLSGELPNVFGNLTMLEEFTAHSNLFTGQLPSTLSLCSKLRVLDLRNNSFSGNIELNFTELSNLHTLDLASNRFYGALPNSLSNCRELKILNLARNEFTGQIPEDYTKLMSLWFLSLSNNSLVSLDGALSVLQQCKNLTTLILTKNFHGEEIPKVAFRFENLIILALGNCGLKGRIPAWLLNCRRLSVLDLSWNCLNGNIPPWIGQMENLFYIDFSNNSLAGEIPKSLTGMKTLTIARCSFPNFAASSGIPLYVKRNQSSTGLPYNQVSSFPPSIYLNRNRINGTILPEIGQLKQLHVLDLSHNNISGTIPGLISEMENLEVLDLSNNNLFGSIPPSFNKLTFLSRFSVAYNHLEGTIPTGGQFFSFSGSSFEGNPGLYGNIFSPHPEIDGIGKKLKSVSDSDSKLSRRSIICITFIAGIGMALLLAFVLLRLSKKRVEVLNEDFAYELGLGPGRTNQLSEAHGSSKLVLFQNSECKDLSIAGLLKATGNFSQANIIGCGGFGLVYKANLSEGRKVAIKRLSGDCGQMEREFQAEVEALSRAQHKNLVSLQGYCQNGSDRLLIYSFMENGSLDYWLHERFNKCSFLNWEIRLRIAQGSARGLAYLHKDCEPNIIHRDVKSSNILLDENFEAHLADFGLSRLLHPYDSHVTTDLVGTLGYIPPEYSQTLTATCRGDVYSFGVVLLELLTGQRAVEVCKGKNSRDLVSWTIQMKSEKREKEVISYEIWDKDHEKQLLQVLDIACKCIEQDPRSRPSIEEVVSWLNTV